MTTTLGFHLKNLVPRTTSLEQFLISLFLNLKLSASDVLALRTVSTSFLLFFNAIFCVDITRDHQFIGRSGEEALLSRIWSKVINFFPVYSHTDKTILLL